MVVDLRKDLGLEILWFMVALAAALFLPVGSILGLVAFRNLNQQAERIHALSLEVKALQARIITDSAPRESAGLQPTTNTALVQAPDELSTAVSMRRAALRSGAKESVQSRLLLSLKKNWMVWLGGLSVALAGIFMVHYTVSEGLLGPWLQLLLALSVGGVLHGGGEYLRRRHQRSDQIFAALAGGGSVTLYAALLAGIHHYHLIEPLLGLVLLAGVSLGTMGLARLHGPLLAVMGLSGAYVVPLLIDSDTGSVGFVLSYSLLITISSLWLMRYVFRNWLWYATLAGALLWWLAALVNGEQVSGALLGNHYLLPIYLSALWLSFALVPTLSKASLTKAASANTIDFPLTTPRLRDVFIALLLAWGISIWGQSVDASIGLGWLLILPVACLIPQSRRALWYLPWGTVLASAVGWLSYRVDLNVDGVYLAQFPLSQQADFSYYLILAALITTGLGFWQWRATDKARWASLTLLSPLVWLLLGWLLLHGLEPSRDWARGALLAGVLYSGLIYLLPKLSHYQSGRVWACLAAHGSYSLAVTMMLREASLTLALAAQLVSLVWLARQFGMPSLYFLVKIVLAVIVARLTFNPWLATYDANTHWSLWTYGGSTLLAAIAAKLSERGHRIRPWLEAATLHLLVLFLGAELRYWLYDGHIFSHQYSFVEATINTLLWGGLSITYTLRAQVAQQLTWLYIGCARVLLGLSGLSYLILVVWYNPWWSGAEISSTPIFNMLLPAYGGPVLLAQVLSRLPALLPKVVALGVAGFSFMLFSALEIRQLWRGSEMNLSLGINNGELYSYSVVGMMYAIVAIIYATKKGDRLIYKVGMVLLGIVIAKIFLIDMNDLQGLWRVAAFMGLGLSLLGLAWMHQKVQRASVLNTTAAL